MSEEGKGYGPFSRLSLTDKLSFVSAHRPPFRTHSSSQETATHPPVKEVHKESNPPNPQPSQARDRGHGVPGSRTQTTYIRIYYSPADPHPSTPPTTTWLKCSGAGGLVARHGGRKAGQARGDLLTVPSCGQETRGLGRGPERTFPVALQDKNALQSRVSPLPISKSGWLGRGLGIVLRTRGHCRPGPHGVAVRPAAVPAGGRREPGGRSRAGRGRGAARRGPGEARPPPPPPAPRLPRRARSSVCLLAGGSRTRGACKHSDTRFFPIKIHFHFF